MALLPRRRTAARPSGRDLGGCVGRPVGLGPVQPLGLQEDDRVVGGDGRAQQPVGVLDGRRGDDLEPGGGEVVRLGGVAVVLDPADAAAVRDADGQRHRQRAAGAVAHPGDMADQLLERRVGEGVELHLDDRPQPVHRHADGGAQDAGLGERGVGAAVLAELLGQAVGDPEDAAQGADVLAHDMDGRVLGHGVAQRAGQRLRHGGGLARGRRSGGRHGLASSAEPSAPAASLGVPGGLGVQLGAQLCRLLRAVGWSARRIRA